MTVTVILSDDSQHSVSIPDNSQESIDQVVEDLQAWTGLAAADWELSNA